MRASITFVVVLMRLHRAFLINHWARAVELPLPGPLDTNFRAKRIAELTPKKSGASTPFSSL